MTKKHVLTGGPGTDKSTVLEVLQSMGYYTLAEVATYLIELEDKKERKVYPWTDIGTFQRRVLETQFRWEKEIPAEREAIYQDRGVIDGLAYYAVAGLKAPKELIEAARNSRYDRIFLLEQVKNPEQSDARRESPQTAMRLHQAVEEAYRQAGYDIVRIPAASAEERARMILQNIGMN